MSTFTWPTVCLGPFSSCGPRNNPVILDDYSPNLLDRSESLVAVNASEAVDNATLALFRNMSGVAREEIKN